MHVSIQINFSMYTVKKHPEGGLVAWPFQVVDVSPPKVTGSNPHGHHNFINWRGAMWQPTTRPRDTISLAKKYNICQQMIHPPIYHIAYPVNIPTHHCHIITIRSTSTSALYGLYSEQNFACLEKWKECNIYRIRRLFEPIRVVLGS
jgi:hypothetical protein